MLNKKWFAIFISSMFIVGCAKKTSVAVVPITDVREISKFDSLVVTGSSNVELINGQSALIAYGYPQDIKDSNAHIAKNVLYIDKVNDKVKMSIRTGSLRNISVFDKANVSSKDFKADNLNILAQNSGSIKLNGEIGINKIYQRGSGKIEVDWVNGDKLNVDSNSAGPIYLSGNADYLQAKLTNNAVMDARYLRVRSAAIFTTDNARADVLVLDALGAFAVDTSNIYYYKNPKHLTVVTKGSGNVLHPDWIK